VPLRRLQDVWPFCRRQVRLHSFQGGDNLASAEISSFGLSTVFTATSLFDLADVDGWSWIYKLLVSDFIVP